MFLLEGSAETVDSGFALEVKKAGVFSDGVPVRVDQDWGGGHFVDDLAGGGFHLRGEGKLNTLFEQGVHGTEPSGKILEEFTVVLNAS